MIKKIFTKYTDVVPSFNEEKIHDICTNLQNSKPHQIIFYQILDGNEDLFYERLEDSSPGLLVLNREIKYTHIPHVVIDWRDHLHLQKDLCDFIYGKPQVSIVGITGTNGKTSTAWFLSNILFQNKKKIVTVGTLGVFEFPNTQLFDLNSTTPSYVQLRKISSMSKYDYIVMEVSSHALAQDRLFDLKLEVAGWSSFSQDHLDYHKTMEEYFLSKKRITNYLQPNSYLCFSQIESELYEKVDFLNKKRTHFFVDSANVDFFWKCVFNRSNFDLAYGMAETLLGYKLNIDLTKVSAPPGRFELVERIKRKFIIDYAHTPDALEKLLNTVNQIKGNKKVCTLFGCGGDRDKLKRSIMGKIAYDLSDRIIVTSDNPRTEKPLSIINDIIKNLPHDIIIEEDRKKAIEKSSEITEHGDIIIIAGKGHENYQEVMGRRKYFSDIETVKGLSRD